MSNEVTEILSALNDGTISIDEAARRFRERSWPRHGKEERPNAEELARMQLEDPEPYVAGSFDDVTLAYQQKKISEQQYEVLARAMAEAKSRDSKSEKS